MSIAITQTAQAPFKKNEAVVFHGRKAHVASISEKVVLSGNGDVWIRYDDEKKDHIVIVPVKELKHQSN